MYYLNKILKCPQPMEALVDLVETNAQNSTFDEKTIYGNFNNYDMALIIILKGSSSRKTESLRGNIYKQYEYIKELLTKYIFPNSQNHITYFELHKCGEWLHSHSILKIKQDGTKTANARRIRSMKQQIFEDINSRKIKTGEQYKHRVLLEKLHTVETWYNYIKKDEPIMMTYNPKIVKLFKLQSINPTPNTISL